MAYKSVLTVVLGPNLDGSAIEGAQAFAAEQDAHLEVLALGLDMSTPAYYYAGANALVEQQALEQA
ncbi:MAG: universal stress protein, partial [Pseudomonadota bacterium]